MFDEYKCECDRFLFIWFNLVIKSKFMVDHKLLKSKQI